MIIINGHAAESPRFKVTCGILFIQLHGKYLWWVRLISLIVRYPTCEGIHNIETTMPNLLIAKDKWVYCLPSMSNWGNNLLGGTIKDSRKSYRPPKKKWLRRSHYVVFIVVHGIGEPNPLTRTIYAKAKWAFVQLMRSTLKTTQSLFYIRTSFKIFIPRSSSGHRFSLTQSSCRK